MIEKEKKLNFFIQEVEKNLKKKLNNYKFDEKNRIFTLDNGEILRVTGFILQGDPLVVAEYADSYEQALKYMPEDGDCFFIDDFTIEEITQGIIEEAYL